MVELGELRASQVIDVLARSGMTPNKTHQVDETKVSIDASDGMHSPLLEE